jgi:hypothetical protein
MPGFHVGKSEETHRKRIFFVPFERPFKKAHGLVVKTQDKAGPAGKEITRRRLGFKGYVVVQGGQGAGIIPNRVQRPAKEEKGLGGAFVFGDNFLERRNGGFVIPPCSGFYRLVKLLRSFTGAPPGSGLPVKTAGFCRKVSLIPPVSIRGGPYRSVL